MVIMRYIIFLLETLSLRYLTTKINAAAINNNESKEKDNKKMITLMILIQIRFNSNEKDFKDPRGFQGLNLKVRRIFPCTYSAFVRGSKSP